MTPDTCHIHVQGAGGGAEQQAHIEEKLRVCRWTDARSDLQLAESGRGVIQQSLSDPGVDGLVKWDAWRG